MFPFFKDKEKVLCLKPFFFNKIKQNDIIIFNHEKEGLMIKKVTKINEQGYYVEGTTPFSIDSSIFGYLKKNQILFKVIFKF